MPRNDSSKNVAGGKSYRFEEMSDASLVSPQKSGHPSLTAVYKKYNMVYAQVAFSYKIELEEMSKLGYLNGDKIGHPRLDDDASKAAFKRTVAGGQARPLEGRIKPGAAQSQLFKSRTNSFVSPAETVHSKQRSGFGTLEDKPVDANADFIQRCK